VLSGASPSIISTSIPPASFRRPATTTSKVACSRSWKVGSIFHSPPIRPIRTAPTGPSKGRPAIMVARLAALMLGMS
jgi:hypothetical protein